MIHFNLQISQASGGIAVPCSAAIGANWRNLDIWNRDKESAKELSVPAICVIFTVKLLVAARKNTLRTRDIILGHFEDPDAHIFVIAKLTQ